MKYLVPNGPVSAADVREAALVLLLRHQRGNHTDWRTDRRFTDKDLAEQIRLHRAPNHALRTNRFNTMFSAEVALDIILAGLPYTPTHVVEVLDAAGITVSSPGPDPQPSVNQFGIPDPPPTATSTTEDIDLALELLHLPSNVVTILTILKVPATEAPLFARVAGEERLRLMREAGLRADELLDMMYSGTLPDLDTLKVMAALASTS